MPQEARDEVVDTIDEWVGKTEINVRHLVTWLEISSSKHYDWRQRYGEENRHNAPVPRRYWLEEWEKDAILAYHAEHQEEGYRRLTYMVLDAMWSR